MLLRVMIDLTNFLKPSLQMSQQLVHCCKGRTYHISWDMNSADTLEECRASSINLEACQGKEATHSTIHVAGEHADKATCLIS